MSDFKKYSNLRRVHRGQITKLYTKLNEAIGLNNVSEADANLSNLREKVVYLTSLDTDILSSDHFQDMEADTFDTFIIETDDYLMEVKSQIRKYELSILELTKKNSKILKSDTTPFNSQKKKTNLPKLQLPIFDGDYLNWCSFIELFTTAVHENEDLSDIEKFNFLTCYLKGDAKRVIEGLPISGKNYEDALSLLKNRYDRSEILIQKYMSGFIEITSPDYNMSSLSTFYDKIQAYIRRVEALGKPPDTYGTLLVPVILQKLPSEMRYNLARGKPEAGWDLVNLCDKLYNEIKILEASKPIFNKPVDTSEGSGPSLSSFHAGVVSSPNANSTRPKTCAFCSGNHFASECKKYSDYGKRREVVKKNGLCFNCLGKHYVSECKSKKSCFHTSLCTKEKSSSKAESSATSATSLMVKSSEPPEVVKCVHIRDNTENYQNHVILKALVVLAADSSLQNQTYGNMLLDDGSQRSFCTREFCDNLQLKSVRHEYISLSTFGNDNASYQSIDVVSLSLRNYEGTWITIELLVVPCISKPLNVPTYDYTSIPEFSSLNLANSDISNQNSFDINVLIGLDNYYKIVLDGVVRSRSGLVAANTIFGYVVCGPTQPQNVLSSMIIVLHAVTKSLDINLDRFWNLESLGISDIDSLPTDSYFIDYVKSSLSFENGNYVAKFPWLLDKKEKLSNNRLLANKRTRSLAVRLHKQPELLKQYDEVIKSHLRREFVEKLDSEQFDGHYIPHHPVIKLSSTTPLRVVFSCNARSSSDLYCLNDCLEKGPCLMNNSLDILMKFRINKYAVLSDIEKAFHNIKLHESDRKYTKFFWLSDINNPLSPFEVYQFNVILFGSTSSPFIMLATIKNHLKLHDCSISKILDENMYMDNFISTMNSEDDLLHYYYKSREIFGKANFVLRSWTSNSSDLKSKATQDGVFDSNPNPSALGMIWNISSDELHLKPINLTNGEILTKRVILSNIGKIFDPMGIFNPVVLSAKLLMQKIWVSSYEWDEILPADITDEWLKICTQLSVIHEISIPRCIGKFGQVTNLHVFSDASLNAYGAVAYLQTIDRCNLLISKSRIVPLKSGKNNTVLTIPKLELLGVLIATRLAKNVLSALSSHFPKMDIHIWTDSEIVLHWLNSDSCSLPVFVKNRINEIKKKFEVNVFHFCPGSMNPADLCTRIFTLDKLRNNDLWFHGPPFLLQPQTVWPSWNYSSTHVNKCSTVETCNSLFNVLDVNRFSSFSKLIRVLSLTIKFIEILRGKANSPVITLPDMKKAEVILFFNVQQLFFSKEYFYLKNTDKLRFSTPPLILQLSLFIDKNELLCSSGRLHMSSLIASAKQPILIPSSHYVTELLVRYVHELSLHSGTSVTIMQLRRKFWIPRIRQVVKSILSSCVPCKKVQGRPFQPPESPPLPSFRVSDCYPFQITGVDFTGCIYISDYCERVYICLFTCANTRAIHLELVHSISLPVFLNCFRRFVSKKGLPALMISDNAQTFKAADNAFNLLKINDLQNSVLSYGVDWKFIPKRAPWFGGFYERLIGLTKKLLKKSIGIRKLSFDELLTYVHEAEFFLNDRPLTYVTSEFNDLEPITPFHLLFGRRLTKYSFENDSDLKNDPDYVVNTDSHAVINYLASKVEDAISNFGTRWKYEYLTSLREFHHLHGKTPHNVNIGAIVQIHADNSPRLHWNLGKIVKLHYGSDNKVRAVDVKTKFGITNRPISKLYPIEVSSSESSSKSDDKSNGSFDEQLKRPQRLAAISAQKAIKNMV